MERPSKRCSGKREDAGPRRWRSVCDVERVGGTQGRMDRQGKAGRGGERPSGTPSSSRAAGGSGCPGDGRGRASREAWGAAGRGGARGHPRWTALSGGPWGPLSRQVPPRKRKWRWARKRLHTDCVAAASAASTPCSQQRLNGKGKRGRERHPSPQACIGCAQHSLPPRTVLQIPQQNCSWPSSVCQTSLHCPALQLSPHFWCNEH